jgi:hypothetical protein
MKGFRGVTFSCSAASRNRKRKSVLRHPEEIDDGAKFPLQPIRRRPRGRSTQVLRLPSSMTSGIRPSDPICTADLPCATSPERLGIGVPSTPRAAPAIPACTAYKRLQRRVRQRAEAFLLRDRSFVVICPPLLTIKDRGSDCVSQEPIDRRDTRRDDNCGARRRDR